MAEALADPLIGHTLDQRYYIDSRIARGGMATVYLAIDGRLDRDVALKVMHPHLADDEQFRARFIREARSAARLSHPNVVQVFDQGEDGETLYLAMEYLPGQTLRDALRSRGALSPREALAVLEPVLAALAAAHRAGIIHRDIKPENVILTDDGRVKVADFGLARAATSATSATGALIGTAAYLSPELVARGIADARSDVYAAGILLYEMLTGVPPFTGEGAVQIAFRHVHEVVPAPSEAAPELPSELDDVVAAATQHDPDARPADGEELLWLVRQAHGELPQEALDVRAHRPAGPLPADWTPTRTLGDLGLHELGFDDRDLGREPGDSGRLLLDPVTASGVIMHRRRRRGRIALAGVLAAAVLLGFGGWWFLAGPGGSISMPKVTGRSSAEAVRILRAQGLGARTEQVFHETVPSGVVVSTEPAAGADIRKNGTAVLAVSRGPQLFAVPQLSGKEPAAAAELLADGSLRRGEIIKRYHDKIASGRVIGTDPPAGQRLRRDQPVALLISLGPKPIKVPDLVGDRVAQAEKQLGKLGLKAAVTERHHDQAPKGEVIEQRPGSGTLLPGKTVQLVVSKGPPLVEVPDVFRMRTEDAERALEAKGFKVRHQGSKILDQVYDQAPDGGALAPKGSTVTIRTF